MRVVRGSFSPPGVVFAPFLLLVSTLAAAQTAPIQAVVDVSISTGRAMAPLTADGVTEAIRLASDEPAARRLLSSYVIWTHAGWGDGPLIGSFSTPFSRVVRAALNARASGRTLTAETVPPSLLTPEVQVIAMSQPAGGADLERSHVQRIVFVRRDQSGAEELIEPLRIVPFTQRYADATNGQVTNAAVMATFPLDVLTTATEIRVQFERTARGSTAMSMCQTCVMRLRSDAIR